MRAPRISQSGGYLTFSHSGRFPRYHSDFFPQIRTLIKQIKEYGVGEDDLFHEDDLLERANIPRVCKCLKEIAIIVSISKEIN